MHESLEKNGYSDVVIHNIALGVQKEVKDLFIPLGHAGAASLKREYPRSKNLSKISVVVENATTYLTNLNLPPIRLVKIDVEGYEAEIIEGASTFFKTNRPDAILFEIGRNHNLPFFQHSVVKKLSELNYQFFCIPKSKFRMRLYPLESNTSKWYGNDILGIQKGDIYDNFVK